MFSEVNTKVRLKILLSYWYYKSADLESLLKKYFTEPYPEIFADSGAFSAETQGAQISLREYADWLKKNKDLITTYSNLDVIGDAGKSLDNQKAMEDMGLAPLPVFHASANYEPLEKLIDAGYPYIALGGLVPYANQPKVRMRFLIRAFQMAKGKAVFHGFGVTSWEVMSQLPWYSVDSSSWGQGFRFGQVPLFDKKRGRFVKVQLGDIKQCSQAQYLFQELGFDWRDFAYRNRNDRAKIAAASALSYIMAEKYLREKFGEIEMPRSSKYGLNVYLADIAGLTNTGNIARADAGLKLYLAEANFEMQDIVKAKNEIEKRGG